MWYPFPYSKDCKAHSNTVTMVRKTPKNILQSTGKGRCLPRHRCSHLQRRFYAFHLPIFFRTNVSASLMAEAIVISPLTSRLANSFAS
jgi:hypothetical protein